jgi:predicted aspartyl protease
VIVSFPFQRGRLILPPIVLEHLFKVDPAMALDTGARRTIITPQLAEEVGITPDFKQGKVQVIGVAGSAWSAAAVVKRISILGLAVEQVEVVCHPLPPRLGLDGILGLNFLQHFNLFIHHDTETVSLEKI